MRPGQPRGIVGLIGYPLGHSISPRFQQAAFDFLALPVDYAAWETPPMDLPSVIERLRQADCLGANVTVPHKQSVMALLNRIDERAARIGAVNTIKREGTSLSGFNTDAEGLVRALGETGFAVEERGVAVLGAGGVARAAAFALAWAGAAELLILARRPEQADALAADLRCERTRVRSGALGRDNARLRSVDLIVNCTSVGMLHSSAEGASPIPGEAIARDTLVYDLVYNPPTTPLLGLARRAGARTLGGLPMLVYQGAAAFEIWTGMRPPIGLMMARAEEALRGR